MTSACSRTCVCVLVCVSLASAAFAAGDVMNDAPLKPWPVNCCYWSYHDEPVLLLGGSDDDNLFQWPEDDLVGQLDRLAAAGGNLIRNTMSDRNDKGFETYPFRRTAGGKYDLEEFDPEYWQRFERLLRETARRKIFVQIEIFDRFDYTDNREANRWQTHPYNPKNNVNYSYDESGFEDRYPDHPGRNKQPFFFTTPKQRNNKTVLRYQERFVGKMLEHSLKYDHVLYCIDNETSAEEAWAVYWTGFVKDRATAAGRRVMVTEMWDDWDIKSDRHRRTFDHPERYDFVDVSQNNHNNGQVHWDNFLFVHNYLIERPRPINSTKIYGAEGSRHGRSAQDAVERFWRMLLAGGASIRFHRPDSGIGLDDTAVAAIRAARKLESVIPLWSIEPAGHLLTDRLDNEAYLAADPGRAYALYFPSGGEVTLDLAAADGKLEVRWINVDTGQWHSTTHLDGGAHLSIASPGRGNFAAAILRQ